MKRIITLNTLRNGKFEITRLSTFGAKASLSTIARRMADLAFKHFGENRTLRNDGSLCGYFAHRVTRQTIEIEHLAE